MTLLAPAENSHVFKISPHADNFAQHRTRGLNSVQRIENLYKVLFDLCLIRAQQMFIHVRPI